MRYTKCIIYGLLLSSMVSLSLENSQGMPTTPLVYNNSRIDRRQVLIPYFGFTWMLSFLTRVLICQTTVSNKVMIAGNVPYDYINIGPNNVHLDRYVKLDPDSVYSWTYVIASQNDSLLAFDFIGHIETINNTGDVGGAQSPYTAAVTVTPYETGMYIGGCYGGGTWFFNKFVNLYGVDTQLCPYTMKVADNGTMLWLWYANCVTTGSSGDSVQVIPQFMVVQKNLLVIGGNVIGSYINVQIYGSIYLMISHGRCTEYVMAIDPASGIPKWAFSIIPYSATTTDHLNYLLFRELVAGPNDIVYWTGHYFGYLINVTDTNLGDSYMINFIAGVNITTGKTNGVSFLLGTGNSVDVSAMASIVYNGGGIIYVGLYAYGDFRLCGTKYLASCSTQAYGGTSSYDYMMLTYNVNTKTWGANDTFTAMFDSYDINYPRTQMLVDPVNRLFYQLLLSRRNDVFPGCPISAHEFYSIGHYNEDIAILVRDLDTMQCIGVASYGTPNGYYPYAREGNMAMSVNPGSNMLYMSSLRIVADIDTAFEPAFLAFSVCPCHVGTCSRFGKCLCYPGYGGRRCEKACPSSSTTTVCSGHGFCNRTTAACVCDVGYTGTNCNTVECSGVGRTATDGSCLCLPGYCGTTCGSTSC